MDSVTIVLTALAVTCVVWFVVVSLLIYDYLRRHGHPVSFIWLRIMLPLYASRYREISRKTTGKVGGLFYQWVISINLCLVLTLLAAAVHYL